MKFHRYYRLLGLALAVAMIMTIAACSKKEQEKSEAVDKMAATEQAAEDYINDQRKEEVEALKAAFEDFSKKFEEFSQRNAYVFSEDKRSLVSRVQEAQTQIEQQLKEARSATEEAWQKIKTDTTATMEKLEKAMVDFES